MLREGYKVWAELWDGHDDPFCLVTIGLTMVVCAVGTAVLLSAGCVACAVVLAACLVVFGAVAYELAKQLTSKKDATEVCAS